MSVSSFVEAITSPDIPILESASDTSTPDSKTSGSSGKRKRPYPAQRRRTRTKKPAYPQNQNTFDLDDGMRELPHSMVNSFNSVGSIRLQSSNSSVGIAEHDLTDIQSCLNQVQDDMCVINQWLDYPQDKDTQSGLELLSNILQPISEEDKQQLAEDLEQVFLSSDEGTVQEGIDILRRIFQIADACDLQNAITYIRGFINSFLPIRPVGAVEASGCFHHIQNAEVRANVERMKNVVNILHNEPTLPFAHCQQIDLLGQTLEQFASRHWNYEARAGKAFTGLLKDADCLMSSLQNSRLPPEHLRGTFSFQEFEDRYNAVTNSCLSILKIFKRYTLRPNDCAGLYKAFRMQEKLWDQGMKACLDLLLEMGCNEEAILYIDRASQRLVEWELELPELKEQWQEIREGLSGYRQCLEENSHCKWGDRGPPLQLPPCDDELVPILQPPLSEHEKLPFVKGAFDIYNDFWNAPLSSSAEIVLKGWSWVGQAFPFSTYEKVSALLCLVDTSVGIFGHL